MTWDEMTARERDAWAAEARKLVGRTFERDGQRRNVVRAFTNEHLGVDYVEFTYNNEYGVVGSIHPLVSFSGWLSGATEVTDG